MQPFNLQACSGGNTVNFSLAAPARPHRSSLMKYCAAETLNCLSRGGGVGTRVSVPFREGMSSLASERANSNRLSANSLRKFLLGRTDFFPEYLEENAINASNDLHRPCSYEKGSCGNEKRMSAMTTTTLRSGGSDWVGLISQ